jgi:hypothetical protein
MPKGRHRRTQKRRAPGQQHSSNRRKQRGTWAAAQTINQSPQTSISALPIQPHARGINHLQENGWLRAGRDVEVGDGTGAAGGAVAVAANGRNGANGPAGKSAAAAANCASRRDSSNSASASHELGAGAAAVVAAESVAVCLSRSPACGKCVVREGGGDCERVGR